MDLPCRGLHSAGLRQVLGGQPKTTACSAAVTCFLVSMASAYVQLLSFPPAVSQIKGTVGRGTLNVTMQSWFGALDSWVEDSGQNPGLQNPDLCAGPCW